MHCFRWSLAVVLVFACGMVHPVFAADTVRVIASKAAIRLNADPGSQIVTTVPAGTVLEVNTVQGDWYAVWLPPEVPGGTRRLGFLAKSDAELQSAAPTPTPAPAPAGVPPARPDALKGDFDGFGGAAFNLPGARALVGTGSGQVADSGERTTHPTFGMSGGWWIGERRIFGVFVDFSGVDAGSAFAEIGSNRSEASSALVDFHGGFQVQAPGRFRPYATIGVGVAFVRDVISLTVNGIEVSSVDQVETVLSAVVGGGVRIMAGEQWGIRVGVDALAMARPDGEGEINYGRFTAAVFYSFK